MIHPNSAECYATLNLSAREEAVLSAFVGELWLTDRQVMAKMGQTDPNACRPRITALVQRGILVECGKTKDETTGKTVRICTIRTD